MDEAMEAVAAGSEIVDPPEDTNAVTSEQDMGSGDTAQQTEPDAEAQPSDGDSDGQGQNAPQGEEQEEADANQVPVSITLNVAGEEKEYTPDEAAPLVENGLKWQAFQESYDKLEYLAESIGKDVPALIDAMMASSEEAAVEKLKEQCGGNEEVAKKLYAYQKQERLSKLGEKKAASLRSKEEMTKAQRDKLQDTLAQGYIELAKEIPDKFPSFKDVPRPVVDMAVKKGISLLDAYLRFEHSENQKRESAKAKQAAAAGSSAGTMESKPVETAPEIDAFLAGLRRSL